MSSRLPPNGATAGAAAAAAAAASAAADSGTDASNPLVASRISSYRPATISGSSTALIDGGRSGSLAAMLATAGARRQAEADAAAAAAAAHDDEFGDDGQARKKQKLSLSEELAMRGAGGGAAGAGGLFSMRNMHSPPTVAGGGAQLGRSSSESGLNLSSINGSALLGGDHGAPDDDADEEDDFFAALDPVRVPGAVPQALFRSLEAGSAAAAAELAAAQAADDAQFAAMTFANPPLDWNLHSKLRFTSSTPFSWVCGHDVAREAEGLASFASASTKDPCNCADSSPLRELHHALHYSVFPATPFTKSHPLTMAIQSALNKPHDTRNQMDRLSIHHLRRTWIQWEDSFRSLYFRLRLPPESPAWLDHFYTVHRGGGGLLSYTVLFLAADAEEPEEAEAGPAAIVSRSNRGLRAVLASRGVEFTMPNSPNALQQQQRDAAASNGAEAASDEAVPPLKPASRHAKLQDESLTSASVLLIRGRKDVHALYDTLLNQERERRELDMPTLLCSSVFLNGAVQSVNIVKVGAGSKNNAGSAGGASAAAASSAATGASSMSDVYTLDIAGPLLPASVVRLLTLFQATQRGSFHATFAPSDYPGQHLNCVNSVIQMDSLRNQRAFGLCTQDSLATHTQVHLAGKQSLRSIGAIKRLKCEGGVFRVELHTQTQ